MTATPRRVVLGVTGSVGAMFSPAFVFALRAMWSAEVRVVMTTAAERFVTVTALAVASQHTVSTAAEDARADGRVPHMELARWADLVLVAPCTANTLSAVACGAAPDALTTLLLAASNPVVLVPSMNESMWHNPAVRRNVSTVRADGIGVIEPVVAPAAVDGAPAHGAMAPVDQVLAATMEWLAARRRLHGPGLSRVS